MTEKKAKILEFENAKKSYDQLTVLKNLNLNVYQGEITCLLGPSGSGKTTVFRTAAGMEELDEGEIIKKDSLRLAYVFQEPRLLPWKTAEENLIFVQKNYNLEKESKLRELLFNLSGLSNFKNSYPYELSGGMKQRLELIRAFAVKADLVFLDEPLKSLDMKTKYNLRKMITLIQKESGISLFFITHDPEEALLLADRIYILAGEGSGIKKEMLIKKDRSQRKISDPELYQKLEEIMAIFTDLVAEFEVDQKDLKEL